MNYTPIDNVNKNKHKGNKIKAAEWNAVCRQLGIDPTGNGFFGDGMRYNSVAKMGRILEYCIGKSNEEIPEYSVLCLDPSGGESSFPPVLKICKAGTNNSDIMANGMALFTNGPDKIFPAIESMIYPIGSTEVVFLRGQNLTVGDFCGVSNQYSLSSDNGGFVCVGNPDSNNIYPVLRNQNQILYGEAANNLQGGYTSLTVNIAKNNDFETGTKQITVYNYLMRESEQQIKTGDRVVIQWSEYNLRWVVIQAECRSEDE